MVKQFIFNHYEVNTYLVADPATRQCAIVDPACQASYEDEQLRKYIADMGLTPSYVLLTHAHVDHIAGLRQVCEFYRLPVTMHADGRKLLRQVSLFDVYRGDKIPSGKKQYALSFTIQDLEKTLTDADVERVMDSLLSAFKEKFGAELR